MKMDESAFTAANKKFIFDWKFCKGDYGDAGKIDFDDSGWRTVDLPHDWSIEGPFIPAG